MSFNNKVVIVTGASSGIGAATAILFSKEGANVAMVGRNETKLKNVAEQCAAVGNAPLVIKADVSNEDEARTIVNDTIQKGKLDVLVNNAGAVEYGTVLDGTILESYDKVVGVNLRAVIHITMLAAPHLVKTKGNIVNISSIGGQMNVHTALTAYGVTKAGLHHFTRGCALEIAASGVRVNVISPGPVMTDMAVAFMAQQNAVDIDMQTPLGRVSQPEEIGELILYLASDKAKGITGSVCVSDNGAMLE